MLLTYWNTSLSSLPFNLQSLLFFLLFVVDQNKSMAIGETILGAVLQVVLDRLASERVVKFFRRSKLDESLDKKLNNMMLAAGKLLADAEEKGMADPHVRQWLTELKHWFYRAEEIVDEIATEALRLSIDEIPSKSSSFEQNVELKMKEVISMLESMIQQKDALGLREVSVATRTPQTQRLPTTCLLEDPKVYGRDHEKQELLKLVLSDRYDKSVGIGVVAIVGMGGMGKTTLAKLVYDDENVRAAFDLRAWVCVSDDFDVFRVTKSILEEVSGQPYPGSHDLNFIHNELSQKLKDKKFLLVLDDVWSEEYEKWESLKAPLLFGAIGSKVIVTTRIPGVGTVMGAGIFSIKELNEEDAWSLFSKYAFEDQNAVVDATLAEIRKKILQKCRGLPLAIKALGGFLRSEQRTEWQGILNSNIWDQCSNNGNVIPDRF